MRAPALLLTVLLLIVAAGCGGNDEPERSPVQEQLAALCTTAREDIEALGLPAEAGFEVLKPWSTRGRRLAKEVGALEGGTKTEQAQIAKLSQELDSYYRSLRIAYEIYRKTKSSETYTVAAERAGAYLESAEALARGLGVSECAERPFGDDPPPGS